LRNPLAPIRNSLHILRLLSEQNADAKQLTELMERQVNHMVRLIDDLLEVSRISSGKIELRKEAIEMASLVRTAVETSRPLIEAAGHHLVVALPPEPLTLHGDPVRLAQVFANLLNNAAKYTQAGGGSGSRSGGKVLRATVSVRDTGVGIPSDNAAPCSSTCSDRSSDTPGKPRAVGNRADPREEPGRVAAAARQCLQRG
jgi:signal transduction histidine kinase